MRKFWALACLFVVAIGCQKADEPAAKTGPTPAPNGAKVKVVFIPKNSGNQYFEEVSKGFTEAADGAGVEYTTVAPASGDATSQIPIIKEQIQRKVDAIVISPNSPNALNEVLDEAKAAGIIVLTVDADLTGNETHRVAAVLSPHFAEVGESQIKLLSEQMKGEGEFAILSATHDAPNQNAWIAAMQETLKKPEYSKLKLVETVYGDDEPQKSTTETDALLSKHPNLKGILSPTSVGLAAAAQAVDIKGVYPGGPNAKGTGLVLTGLSTPNQLKKFVDKGVVTGFQLWSPYDMGWLSCYLAKGLKDGSIKAEEGQEFDVPKLGKRKFEKDNVIVAGPLVTFDKSNMANYNF